MCESIEQNKGRVVDWDSIQWDIPKRHVRRLQERIFRAEARAPCGETCTRGS